MEYNPWITPVNARRTPEPSTPGGSSSRRLQTAPQSIHLTALRDVANVEIMEGHHVVVRRSQTV